MTRQFVQIGSFIILTRMLIHLSVGKKNEKYMKVLAGVLVIAKIVSVLAGTIGENRDFEYRLNSQRIKWENYLKNTESQTKLLEREFDDIENWQEEYVDKVLEQAEGEK